ncbi:hypothetical protein LXL04_023252 [Taraxacum kok-saghyz]
MKYKKYIEISELWSRRYQVGIRAIVALLSVMPIEHIDNELEDTIGGQPDEYIIIPCEYIMKPSSNIEVYFETSKCQPYLKVRFATTLQQRAALHWWNGVRFTYGISQAAELSWDDFNVMIEENYFSRSETLKLESEFLRLEMGNDSIQPYTQKSPIYYPRYKVFVIHFVFDIYVNAWQMKVSYIHIDDEVDTWKSS